MEYALHQIATVVHGKSFVKQEAIIAQVATDSRSLSLNQSTLFFCIVGDKYNGHHYIEQCIEKGICNFIVSDDTDIKKHNTINYIVVEDTLLALQQLAAFHRSQFNIPVIGITGSNGKTIVKEWLFQMLSDDFNIVKSPKSYNSQIGVPLSVFQMIEHHNLAILEAGISTTNEMLHLQKIIQPTLGVFTNIGKAHAQGFTNQIEKAKEKLILFKASSTVIYPNKFKVIEDFVKDNKQYKAFGKKETSFYNITNQTTKNNTTEITINDNLFSIPFTDDASIENALHCICILLELNFEPNRINEKLTKLKKLPMRLSLNYGINQCTIIDDSYSADFSGLQIALDFLHQQATNKNRTLILSVFDESGLDEANFIQQLINITLPYQINKIIGIGNIYNQYKTELLQNFKEVLCFDNAMEFIQTFYQLHFFNEIILIKGARKFQFENISQLLIGKTHETILEININSLVNNYNTYKKLLTSKTGIIAMVKAFSYGSGSVEIASVLQTLGASYLAVAYADEGVHLRNNGITIPIMVMNPAAIDFSRMIEYNLEPTIYNLYILNQLVEQIAYYNINVFKIHIKLETGMFRLGFEEKDIAILTTIIKSQTKLKIATVFSHLSSSEDDTESAYSLNQIDLFEKMYNYIQSEFNYTIQKHILNSAGIVNFPQAYYDFVRLGIGLYGIDTTTKIQHQLQNISVLKTRITQIKSVKQGETIGYNRKGIAAKDMTIAVLAIGYADGFDRRFSNGIGEVFINNQKATIIGNVCMDMTMIDISNINDIQEGDEVEVFGSHISINEQAKKIGTIGYELLTSISSRVKRVYYLD